MITLNNFYNNTKAYFQACKKPTHKPDFISESGSMYWYGVNNNGVYVIRYSDHWTRLECTNDKMVLKQIQSYYRHSKYKDWPPTTSSYNNYLSTNHKISSCVWNLFGEINGQPINCGKCYLQNFKKLQ